MITHQDHYEHNRKYEELSHKRAGFIQERSSYLNLMPCCCLRTQTINLTTIAFELCCCEREYPSAGRVQLGGTKLHLRYLLDSEQVYWDNFLLTDIYVVARPGLEWYENTY